MVLTLGMRGTERMECNTQKLSSLELITCLTHPSLPPQKKEAIESLRLQITFRDIQLQCYSTGGKALIAINIWPISILNG